MTASALLKDLQNHATRSPKDLQAVARFFKTGTGEYGEGDTFIGVSVPTTRAVCKKYRDMPLAEIEKALESNIHEARLAAVIIMVEQAKHAGDAHKKALYQLYLRRTDRINNWDIVDSSCPQVVGGYIAGKDHAILYKLAQSPSLWERRIAIISTLWFIRLGQLDDTFKIAKELLGDPHDLIHKATGWALREAGKHDQPRLRQFLDAHAAHMPRTMLRYAIEKFDAKDRAYYLAKK